MHDIQQFFIDNPLWGIIIAAVIAVLIGYISYQKGKKNRKPKYYIKSNNLITDFKSKISDFKMLFRDVQIERLTVSKMGFWNDGSETISNENNVPKTDPIRIVSSAEYEILDVKIIKQTNPKINVFSVSQVNKNTVNVNFNIIDKGQGCAIEIIHTGKGSTDLGMEGYVEGAGKPQVSFNKDVVFRFIDKAITPQRQSQDVKHQPAKVRRAMGIFALVIAFVMIVAVVISTISITSIILGAISILFYVYIGYLGFKRRVPKELDIVEEEDSDVQ
jgi:hypothetical protein